MGWGGGKVGVNGYRGEGFALFALTGMEFGCGPLFEVDPTLCRGVEVCTPIISYSPVVSGIDNCQGVAYFDLVLRRVNEFHRVVGVSCVSYEKQFMAIFSVIEASCSRKVSSLSWQ